MTPKDYAKFIGNPTIPKRIVFRIGIWKSQFIEWFNLMTLRLIWPGYHRIDYFKIFRRIKDRSKDDTI